MKQISGTDVNFDEAIVAGLSEELVAQGLLDIKIDRALEDVQKVIESTNQKDKSDEKILSMVKDLVKS